MKNLKIQFKLWISFGIILLLMVAFMFTSFFGMQMINDSTKTISNISLKNIESVWSMRKDLISAQRYLLAALDAKDPAQIKELMEKSDVDATAINDTFTAYEKTMRAKKDDVETLKGQLKQINSARIAINGYLLQETAETHNFASLTYTNNYAPCIENVSASLDALAKGENLERDVQTKNATKTYIVSIGILAAVFALSIVATIVLILRLLKYIMKPVTQIEKAIVDLSNGKLDTKITYSSKDQFGSACDSMRKSMKQINDIISEISTNMIALEHGNFTLKDSDVAFPGAFEQIKSSLANFVATMNAVLHQLSSSAEQVESGSNQVSAGAQALAQGSTEQASAVEEVVANITEMSKQINDNAINSQSASELALAVGDEMTDSSKKMNDMMSAMNDITASSREINKIISSIEDIAFQTNILALNAAVEAARAGEAGKGFAVVADEVRNLATKSSEASKNTSVLIENSLKAVDNGTKIADLTAKTLTSASQGVDKVISLMKGISSASEDQSLSAAQITDRIGSISAVVQTNSATAEENAAASEELSAQAQTLKKLAGKFILDNNIDVASSVLMADETVDEKLAEAISDNVLPDSITYSSDGQPVSITSEDDEPGTPPLEYGNDDNEASEETSEIQADTPDFSGNSSSKY